MPIVVGMYRRMTLPMLRIESGAVEAGMSGVGLQERARREGRFRPRRCENAGTILKSTLLRQDQNPNGGLGRVPGS